MLVNKIIDYHPNNCKIYTPDKISNIMIEELDIKWENNIKILEPAVGTGNILIPLLKKFLEYFKNSINIDISCKMRETFWVFDVDKNSLDELNKNIKNLCAKYNIEYNHEINIEQKNILSSDFTIKYDYIIANPPYISKKNLNFEQRKALKSSVTCLKYTYDIYFYFFEKSIDLLKPNGTLVFITPNTYLNSISAFELRKKILNSSRPEKIINFPNQNIFKGALVKVCITKLSKKNIESNMICEYLEYDNGTCLMKKNIHLNEKNFLVDRVVYDKIDIKFQDLFYISGGIATLNDNFFIIKKNEIIKENSKYIFIKKDNVVYPIEKILIKNAIRPRMGKIINKIIYPYMENSKKIEEHIIKEKYPRYYEYFTNCNFAKSLYYGRSQGLKHLGDNKLVFPKITSKFKPYKSKNELVVSGIYFVPLNEKAVSLLPQIEKNHLNILERIKFNCKNHGSNTYTINTSVLKHLPIDDLN